MCILGESSTHCYGNIVEKFEELGIYSDPSQTFRYCDAPHFLDQTAAIYDC